MKRWIMVAVLCAVPFTAMAQPAADARKAQEEAMAKLAWIVGEWSGGGWILGRDGTRQEFLQNERIEARLGGTVMLIEGLGRSPAKEGEEMGAIVHHALAVVSYDPMTEKYLFRSHTGEGRYVDADFTIGDGEFQWGFKAGQGPEIRYHIVHAQDGAWIENGEMSMDGKEWKQFFGMTLTRLKKQ